MSGNGDPGWSRHCQFFSEQESVLFYFTSLSHPHHDYEDVDDDGGKHLFPKKLWIFFYL